MQARVGNGPPLLPEGESRYLNSGCQGWSELHGALSRSAFEQGCLTLVVLATEKALGHLISFLATVQPARLLVLADEADDLWSYHVTPSKAQTGFTKREERLYDLLTSNLPVHACIQVWAGLATLLLGACTTAV